MKIIKTPFKGLKIIKLKKHSDKRGNLVETFRENRLKGKKLIFDYRVFSKKNILRGFHFQTKYPQIKYINVLKGKVLEVVIDLRKNSKTFGKHFKIILSEKNSTSLYVPEGFAHGFCGLDKENYLLYSCSNYRDKKAEIGIKWNDKDLKIKWPIKNPIVSKRDKMALTFYEYKKLHMKNS